jgi:hypothetical protein
VLLLVLLEGACICNNQRSRDKRSRDTGEQVSKLLSFSHYFSLLKLSSKKKKKNVARSSLLLAITTALRGRSSAANCNALLASVAAALRTSAATTPWATVQCCHLPSLQWRLNSTRPT